MFFDALNTNFDYEDEIYQNYDLYFFPIMWGYLRAGEQVKEMLGSLTTLVGEGEKTEKN